MSRSSLIVLSLAAAFAASVIVSARRSRVSERHTLAWLAVAAGIAVLAVWREGIAAIARAMEIYYPPSALFLVGGVVLMWLVYRQGLHLAKLKTHVMTLTQQLALLSAEHEMLASKSDSRPPQ